MPPGTSWEQARDRTRHIREQNLASPTKTKSLADQHNQLAHEVRVLLDEMTKRQDVQEFVEQLRANIRKP